MHQGPGLADWMVQQSGTRRLATMQTLHQLGEEAIQAFSLKISQSVELAEANPLRRIREVAGIVKTAVWMAA